MGVVFDFSVVPGPSADQIKAHDGEGTLIYGTGRTQSPEYVASLERAGLQVSRIWEHNTDSILGGYDYGVSECRIFEANNPPGLVYLACDLNDGALGNRDPLPFCRGWCSVTREDAVGAYGPDHFILAAQAAAIPKLSRWWGVVNWIQGGGPDNHPTNIAFWNDHGAHLIQMIGSPIPETDQNMVLHPDWHTTGSAPASKEQDDMVLYSTNEGGTTTYYRDAGGIPVKLSDGEARDIVPHLGEGWVHVIEVHGGTLGVFAMAAETVKAERFAQTLVK